LPLILKPVKGGASTRYLRMPKDLMTMYDITDETPITFELLDDERGVRLVYWLPNAARKKKQEKKKENRS